jgi:hypothetical protein
MSVRRDALMSVGSFFCSLVIPGSRLVWPFSQKPGSDPSRHWRFPRCLARYRADDGRGGLGWIEWNQPQLG